MTKTSVKAKIRTDPENPYNTGIWCWKVVACGYCGAQIGQYCVVRGTNRMAQSVHDVRFDMRRAAYDAWEKGRKHGQREVADALAPIITAYQDRKATITEVKAG